MTSTDIVKWRKTNDYEILKKGGGSREKGEEETKSMPHAPVVLIIIYHHFHWFYFIKILSDFIRFIYICYLKITIKSM